MINYQWQPIGEFRVPEEPVKMLIVTVDNDQRPTIRLATYYPKLSFEDGALDMDHDWYDYDENEVAYCPEGWYEACSAVDSQYDYWQVTDTVAWFAHLMPVPEDLQ